MGVYRLERTITLTGSGGPNVTAVFGSDQLDFRGVLRAVKVRYVTGDHVFTAFGLSAGHFPKNLVAAGVPLDVSGRPTTPQAVQSVVPSERRAWTSAAITAGAASALNGCYAETIPGEDRPVVVGPWSLSAQWTVSGGSASTFVVSLEFDSGVE